MTGGAGFVGHEVVRALARRGVSVRVLDPGPAHARWPEGVEHARSDLLDARTLQDAARGCDGVFHVAGTWDSRPGGDARMRALNVGGTRAVLGLGVPVVYTSSSITCGFGPWHRPGTEDEPSEDPKNPIRGTGQVYRLTKLEAEGLVRQAGGFIVNPDYVIGPGDVHGVVTAPLIRASRMRVVPAPRGGKCFVSAHDVGEGHVLAWERARPGRRYLLGSENLRYSDVLRRLAELQGVPLRLVALPTSVPRMLRRAPVVGQKAGAIEQMNLARFRSPRRAMEELGFRPGPVDQAFQDLLAATR